VVEARDDAATRTDRPTDAADETLPTVREVLAMPALVDAVPEVLVGDAALDARVRWVHTSEISGVAEFLNGGELILTQGTYWATDADAQRTFVASLASAGASALVLELGMPHTSVPPAVLEAARDQGLALIALHNDTRFVVITEAVHRRIISEQTIALRARDEARERFTALALRGSPADFIVDQLSQTLGAPVVLENLAHEVVAAEVPLALEEELFGHWETLSRDAHRADGRRRADGRPADAEDWLIVPVEARRARWGHLVALPGPPHPAGRQSVLEQGAIALALGRLADGGADEWGRIGRQRLLDGLLAGRFAGTGGAAARLEAAGVRIDGARLYGMVLSGVAASSEDVDAALRPLRGRALTGSAPAGVTATSAAILVSLPAATSLDDATAREFLGAVAGDAADRAVLSIGSAARGIDGALASLQEAIDLAKGRGWREARGPRIRRAEDRPLVRLVTGLRDDHRLLDHGERSLAPLIDYDLARGGDLLDVLGAMLAHPGNRTAAASASHLSRSVFYQRIALIEDLLGVDLDDGETLTALHLALMVRRSAGR
jgi:PucR family transcriptional regulator, purine catabolism regulatory protein